METAAPPAFCSDLSREAGESMIGTAARVDAWFLLEYDGVWGAKATDENALPRPVQKWLKENVSAVSEGRLQFIKRDRPAGSGGISFYVALPREITPVCYRFSIDAYEDLLDLDLQAIASGDSVFDAFIHRESLFLVCTNGRRDRCCARNGPALFQGLVEHAGDAVWQCTHLGGHRFAPTLLTVPDGAYYGRLTPADLPEFAKSQQNGHLYLDNLRGRCCYDKPAQAAEHFLRQKTGVIEREAYRLTSSRRLDDAHWAVTFAAFKPGVVHRLTVVQEETASEQVVSCSPLKTEAVGHFRLANHEISKAGAGGTSWGLDALS